MSKEWEICLQHTYSTNYSITLPDSKFPELYVKTLQHTTTITTGILHHLDVPQQVIDKLVQRVGAADSRFVCVLG